MHFRLIALFTFFYLLVPCIGAADELHSVRIGVFPLEPLNFTDKMGNAQGVYPDLLREMVREEKWHLVFVPGSWKECLERLESGGIDLITSIAHSPERALKYDYTKESVVDNWSQIFTYPGSGIESFKDLGGKQVAIVERDINGKNFLKTVKNMGITVEVIRYATNAGTFRAVQNREVAAAVSSQHYGLRHTDAYDLVATSIQFSPVSIYIAALKGRQNHVLKHLDQHLATWKQDKSSYYYTVLQKHLGSRVIETQVFPGWALYVAGVVLGLLLLGALWIVSLNHLVRKRTIELRESENNYRTVANYTYNWESWISPDYTVRYVSPSCERITGYRPEDFMNDSGLFDRLISAEDREVWQKHLDDPGEVCELLEHRIVAKDGSTKWIGHTCQNVYGPDGEYQGKRVSNRDITNVKNIHDQLRQSQKMEAIGTLAGGIAHDFNNILSAILGYTELTLRNPNCDAKTQKNLNFVVTAAGRARELVKQILIFSKKGNVNRGPVRLHYVVAEAVELLRKTIPATISIRLDIDANAETILADSTQIHQVVMNLCTNAYHSMPEQTGEIDISLKPVDIDAACALKYTNLHQGRYCQLTVSDTGTGVSPEMLPRIFDPFYTTKGEGTGLGLAVVHGIVQKHDGAIGVESDVGKGTTFKVFFPLSSETPENIKQAADLSVSQRGTESILFVDDEPMLAELGKETLELLGYRVTATTSALKALDLFLTDIGGYDLIVTDQTMPEMSGDILAKKALQLRADIPIIICTGHSAVLDAEKAQAIGVKTLLMKPLEGNILAKEVRKVLDALT